MTDDRPLAIDIFCGLGGWTEGLIAEGWRVVGFDIERHQYDGMPEYPAQLVLQDARTIHGKQFKDARLIVASSPCPEYSYMAMPWSRAKQIARAFRGLDVFPDGYTGSRTIAELNELFDQPARIQREACEAAGRYIPMIQENVKGAQLWVGRARWNFGSYYLWGDVPAMMPMAAKAQKCNPDGTAHGAGSWFAIADSKNRGASDGVKVAGMNWSGSDKPGYKAQAFNDTAIKNAGGSWFNVAHNTTSGTGQNPVHDGTKQGGDWFSDARSGGRQGGISRLAGKSHARKAASARIAKIPLTLARHIAHIYHPDRQR